MTKHPQGEPKPIPMVGLGTARLKGKACTQAVTEALQANCRHLDCAKFYGNERFIGTALRHAFDSNLVIREDLYITSKLWNDSHEPPHVYKSCLQSIQDLKVDYLDLYLMHWPVAWKRGTLGCPNYNVTIKQTWQAMELLVDEGHVKQIGVSNFGIQALQQLLRDARIKPSVNQVELHPYLQQPQLVQYCQANNITCVAWSPLAKLGRNLLRNDIVTEIALQNKMTCCQVILKHNVQRGVVVIPQSSNPQHMRDNVQIMDNKSMLLSQEQLKLMSLLDCHKRCFPDLVGVFEDTPVIPFHVIGYTLYGLGLAFWFVVPHVFDFSNPQSWHPKEILLQDNIHWLDQVRMGVLAMLLIRWMFM